MAWKRIAAVIVSASLCCCRSSDAPQQVGPREDGAFVVTTEQLIRPAGRSVAYAGRPVDLALSPDGKTLYVKSGPAVVAIDAATFEIRQQLAFGPKPGGGSMHGIIVTPDGKRVLATVQTEIEIARVGDDGKLVGEAPIEITGTAKGRNSNSYPCGLAMIGADRVAVCLSMNNTLGVVNLSTRKLEREIAVGMAPYGVAVSLDGKLAYVSNWGGRRPMQGDRTAESGGSDVVVDERGVASSGTVGVVDVAAGKMIAEIAVGLHPADVELSADGATLYVANANSDTVSVIDTSSRSVRETISVRPDERLPFGSMSNALALSGDGKTLFVANGGNNAVAVVDLGGSRGRVKGFIPVGWYPGAVAARGDDLFVANTKGVGSRNPKNAGKWNSHNYWGTVTHVRTPDAATLAAYTKQVREDALVPRTLAAWEKAHAGRKPVPVPKRVGEPSVFEHVVYIIKENRTYDQLLGDMPRGNGDAKLCVFGKQITPNHHAIAEQFVLLDNFYCNGVLSADGHQWITQGLANDYVEKSMGGWSRSYPYPGDDALAFASTGFIWDNVLLHGGSFRNYGEMSVTRREGRETWVDIYNAWKNKSEKFEFKHEIANASLARYCSPIAPGWNLRIPDQVRADAFITELNEAEKSGHWQNLSILFLPNDHGAGTAPGMPTPAAMMADNDLALGRVVEAISKSKFWPKTCIFVIEDDPQAGFDHVDGHRSLCLVISPYTKRRAVVSRFYNQTSVLHTMELMLGCPPMNQLDAMAPVMRECFTSNANLTPYQCLANTHPLDEMNPEKKALSGERLELAEQSEKLPLDRPDLADENTLNRIVWHSVRGTDARYPAELAGAHGKGLKKLGLKLDANAGDEDDDD